MYRPYGYSGDIGDVEIIEHEGVLHIFHLVVPNRDLVAHAISEDGLSLRRVAPAIRTGDPGSFDDDMIRTVSVTRRGDQFVMLYSATSERDGGRVERMGCAVSMDLYHWTKQCDYPILEPDSAIYESSINERINNISWRDPKPYCENGRYYCLLCARTNAGPYLLRGCAALAESTDLIHWRQQEPIFMPNSCYTLECPQLYKMGGVYYLIASLKEEFSQRYWMAENPKGPFRVPPGGTLLFPRNTHYAARLGMFRGRDVLACWTFAYEDGPSPFGLKRSPGAEIKYVPALLNVRQESDGRLTLHSIDEWDTYAVQSPQQIGELRAICGSEPSYSHDENAIRLASAHGNSVAYTAERFKDFSLRGNMRFHGYRAGLLFHGSEDGSAYRVELLPDEYSIRLVKHVATINADGCTGFGMQVLAQAPFQFAPNVPIPFLLRIVNGEMEVSMGGRVLFSTVSTAMQYGFVGMFADNADLEIRDLSIQQMRAPCNVYP